ncbi:filamentous hemagglutinin N-terminal domain-containing protein, partial [Spirulina sp. CS-785/01]|uniref:two-partner secretion domain-containing protein n=1 Tax=Spirulina sp. CS-785/01 TaxID=3021716 RepID=UPI0023314698
MNWQTIGLLSLSLCLLPGPVKAQIAPDETLPNNTTVMPIPAPFPGDTFLIEGGTQAGTNLFHSFTQFSVPTQGAAIFNNAPTIENIFGRVTGGSSSLIDGLIQANGAANLYLLNPNGILFGPNGALNLGGSFFASTANRILFVDGTQFATNPKESSPLLTVSVPTALQFSGTPGAIRVQGTGHNFGLSPEGILLSSPPLTGTVPPTPGLQVAEGETLALVGGEVVLAGGNLTASDGRIEVGSVGENAQVGLTEQGLDYSEVQRFQEITLTESASLNTSGQGEGRIHLQGGRVMLEEGAVVVNNNVGAEAGGGIVVNGSESLTLQGTQTGGVLPTSILSEAIPLGPESTGTGGDIALNTPELVLRGGAQVSSSTFSTADGGDLQVSAGRVMIQGATPTGNPSGLFAATAGPGDAGRLTVEIDGEIEPNGIILADGGRMATETFSPGQGGELSLSTTSLEIRGTTPNGAPSGLFARTVGFALGGNISIEGEEVRVEENGIISTTTQGEGQPGGDIMVDSDRVALQRGGQIQAGTLGAGDSGDLIIQADTVILRGRGIERSGLFNQVDAVDATGQGGVLNVDTRQLQIADGAQVSAGTFGHGDGGQVNVRASESVEITSSSEAGLSGIFTQVDEQARGEGGDIRVQTPRLTVQSESTISAGTLGRGNGGSVRVDASEWVEIQGENGGVSARTRGSGNAGDVSITTPRLIIGSQGSATVESLGTGDAGDLQISSDYIDLNQSRITGETTSGQGGSVRVDASEWVEIQGENGGVSARTRGSGNAGDVSITTPRLIIG